MNKKPKTFKQWLERIREYNEIANIPDIARRYFANNAFDGILTMIGVLTGNQAAGVQDPQIVITTGLTTTIAVGISGFAGAYMTESAERKREIDELNQISLSDLNGSRIGKASRFAAIAISIIDGLSPFLSGIMVLSPFFFSSLFPSIQYVYYACLGFALIVLFGLGLFLGNVSKQNLIISGIKTVAAGLISILISVLLGA